MDLCYSIQELNAKLKKHSILFSAFKPLPASYSTWSERVSDRRPRAHVQVNCTHIP